MIKVTRVWSGFLVYVTSISVCTARFPSRQARCSPHSTN